MGPEAKPWAYTSSPVPSGSAIVRYRAGVTTKPTAGGITRMNPAAESVPMIGRVAARIVAERDEGDDVLGAIIEGGTRSAWRMPIAPDPSGARQREMRLAT